MGEDGEGKGGFPGRRGGGVMEDAAGDEGVAKEAGDDGVREDRFEAMEGVAAFEGEETGMFLKEVVRCDPWRIL